jgi:hypothetical protein
MDTSVICLLAGPIISGGVSLLKRVPFVKRYPKSVSFALSAIIGGITAVTGGAVGVGIAEVTQCVLIPFAGAVTTYEAVTRQVTKVVDIGPPIGPGSGDAERDRI